MIQYAHRTRFDWHALFAGDRQRLVEKFKSSNSPMPVNVLTALMHLARRDERYKDVEIAYNLLSDFAHPNMASHAASDLHKNDIAAQPVRLRAEFFMVVRLPWVTLGVGTTLELLMDIAPLLEVWLDYVDHGARLAIDFRK
jgi:hypothetical protein